MKNLNYILPAITLALLMSGCGTLDKSGPYAGDKFLYATDVAITTTYDVIHTFVMFEYTNREALKKTNPNMTKVADDIRLRAPQWFGTAIALRDAYKATPNSGTKNALTTAIDVLQAAALEATRYLAVQNPSIPVPSNQIP